MKTIYVTDKNDVCCPNCYNEITHDELAKATKITPLGNLTRSKMNCPHCETELELRSP